MSPPPDETDSPTPRPGMADPLARAMLVAIANEMKTDVANAIGSLEKRQASAAKKIGVLLASLVFFACLAQCGVAVYLQNGVRDSIEDLDRRLRRLEERKPAP